MTQPETLRNFPFAKIQGQEMGEEEDQADTPSASTGEASNAPARPSHLWRKNGPSPNPAGRPKNPKNAAEVRALAQEKSGAMLEFLARTALNPKVPYNARVTAAIRVLDQAYGRPHQSMDINHGAKDGLATLLDEINGRFPIRTIEGSIERPALEVKQSLLDRGQGGQPNPVPNELGTRKSDE
jgi:hypothetical protein